MTHLARTIHLDESDRNVFRWAAQTGEWAISGGFEFSNWTESELTGKARQDFANGWLGLDTFGRATFVAIAKIEAAEHAALTERLAAHFVEHYGAPDIDAARGVAEAEIAYMAELCAPHEANTLLAVSRTLTEDGVHEQFRHIKPADAPLDIVAVHVSQD